MIVMLLVTRNESSLLRENLRHHLDWGVDLVAVADNESTDATREVVREFGSGAEVRRFHDFHQRQTTRHMILRDMIEAGRPVEWVAISDTDEFFWAPVSGVRDLLSDVPDDVVAVNFDAKLFLPTGLDSPEGPPIVRRTYRTARDDSPLHTSYREGKTFYRASWLASIPVDHLCNPHEHLCLLVPHERYRHQVPAVHHYMIQDEDQFVEKVARLVQWARRPKGFRKGARWSLTPKSKRPLAQWEPRWKKEWWGIYQQSGEEGVRRYYRDKYTIPAAEVPQLVASGDLIQDDAFANYSRRFSD